METIKTIEKIGPKQWRVCVIELNNETRQLGKCYIGTFRWYTFAWFVAEWTQTVWKMRRHDA